MNISQKITIGSTKRKPVNKIKKFDRKLHKCCVIHLIELDKEELDLEYVEASDVEKYITDQIPDLWNDMKAGDLIENTTESGYRSTGVYCVDFNHKQTEGECLIKNGLCIVEQECSYDDYGTVPLNFYAITRFPLNYHKLGFNDNNDNMVVNNTYSPEFYKSSAYWHTEPYYAPLDVKKLKLDSLTDDNIFEHKFSFENAFNKNSKFYYLVITFKKQNYIICTFGSEEQDLIDMFKNKPNVNKYYIINSGESAIESIVYVEDDKYNEILKGKDKRKTELYNLLENEKVELSHLLYLDA